MHVSRSIARIIKRNLPGVGHYMLGRRLFGVVVFSYFLFFLIVLAANAGRFWDGLQSLGLSVWLLVTEYGSRAMILQGDIAEHWLSSVTVIAVPVAIWWFTRKFYIRLLTRDREHEISQWTIALRALRKSSLAMVGTCIVVFMYSIALLCPFLVSYHPNAFQDGVVTQFLPPMSTVQVLLLKEERIRSMDKEFIRKGSERFSGVMGHLLRINARLTDAGISKQIAVEAFRVEESEVIATVGVESIVVPISALISAEPGEFLRREVHILGTDSYGRDLLSRIIYGSRISLSLGFITVLLSISIGTFVGLFAGYFGGLTDSMLMRFIDVLLAFPSLFLILIIISVFEKIPLPRIALIILVLGSTSWMGIARLVRAEVLTLKEREFIVAARALGLNHARIILRHILPNSLTPIIVNATIRIGAIILLEAALSFLNIGVQQPTASWGNIIFEGKDFLSRAWWISTFPGFAIVLIVVSFNLIGDGLRDAFDPMLKET